MANIRIDIDHVLKDGLELVFIAPCDCSSTTGLNVYHPDVNGSNKVTTFVFKDAHGNNLTQVSSFAEGVYVKVILNTTDNIAYIQNGDTNKYLEDRFEDIDDHRNDETIHVTSQEKQAWNNKSNFSGNYNDLSNKPAIPDISGKLDKNHGSTNAGKILVVGTDGNLVLIDMPEGGTDGDIIGVIDEANNILLMGDLADGTYTLKYENKDGTYANIGTLKVGETITYTVTNNLTECSTDNLATSIIEGIGYSATILANKGYELSSITVKMGGIDITSTAVNGGTINIASVTGDIIITAVAEVVVPDEPTVTNLIPLSTNADGTPYNGGKGYKTGYRISVSGGGESADSDIECTGFMPVGYNDTLYFKDIGFASSGTNNNYCFYDSSKARIAGGNFNNYVQGGSTGNGTIISGSLAIKDMQLNQVVGDINNVAFIRISASNINDNSIITKNQPIA